MVDQKVKKLDLIDNKRTTIEVNIPRDRIFIANSSLPAYLNQAQ